MKKEDIKPRGKYVFVKVDTEESRESANGIITPSNVEQERKSTGTVLSLSKFVDDLKKGDRVIFGTYAGEDVKISGSAYKLLEETDILATI